MDILFSHKPMEDLGYFDLNIHGHFHNSIPERHEESAKKVKSNKHLLVMLEHHYQPQSLDTVIKRKFFHTKKRDTVL